MIRHSATHTSFSLERHFMAPPERVFAAWSDPQAKQRWSDCHAEVGTLEYAMDFRVGGKEIHRALLPGGREQSVEKVFLEIVPDRRIIFAYAMQADLQHLSASLVTVEFHPESGGTYLLLTEQLAYLDGYYDLEERRQGTSEGLDRLVLEVAEHLGEA